MSTLVILRNQPSGQSLVKSTKLERIVTDSKSARHKEKKEKKERRKLKKEKHEKKSHKHSSKGSKKHYLGISDDSEQLEKSDLTEELEEPQNQLGYLSDGSQNSKKRTRDDSPPAVESLIKVAAAPVAGNPLRIRLIFKKPKEAVPTLPQEDLVHSTSVTKPISHQDVGAKSVSCSKVPEPEENFPITSSNVPEHEENLLSTSAVALVESKKRKKHKPSKEDRYNALFDDWSPSSICFAGDSSSKDDGDDWLFGNKTQEKLTPKAAVKIDDNMSMRFHNRHMDSSWPKAQFLSEVGIHSLPYTVPF